MDMPALKDRPAPLICKIDRGDSVKISLAKLPEWLNLLFGENGNGNIQAVRSSGVRLELLWVANRQAATTIPTVQHWRNFFSELLANTDEFLSKWCG
jgi:hypothetical protein